MEHFSHSYMNIAIHLYDSNYFICEYCFIIKIAKNVFINFQFIEILIMCSYVDGTRTIKL